MGIGAMSCQDKRWYLLGYDNVIESQQTPPLKNSSYIISPFINLFSLSLSHTHTHTRTQSSLLHSLLIGLTDLIEDRGLLREIEKQWSEEKKDNR